MNEVRIGIIGSGFMGRTNAETVRRYLDRARLVAITGGSRAAKLVREYGADLEPSVESLVARADIDAVLISTPHAQHAAQAMAAAQARQAHPARQAHGHHGGGVRPHPGSRARGQASS